MASNHSFNVSNVNFSCWVFVGCDFYFYRYEKKPTFFFEMFRIDLEVFFSHEANSQLTDHRFCSLFFWFNQLCIRRQWLRMLLISIGIVRSLAVFVVFRSCQSLQSQIEI